MVSALFKIERPSERALRLFPFFIPLLCFPWKYFRVNGNSVALRLFAWWLARGCSPVARSPRGTHFWPVLPNIAFVPSIELVVLCVWVASICLPDWLV